jgi:hypothetical protein
MSTAAGPGGFVPWKAMIVGSVILTIVDNLVPRVI